MFFKTLTIQGFKSFADKTVLQFDAKTTAVVGSNGNGKSNIYLLIERGYNIKIITDNGMAVDELRIK